MNISLKKLNLRYVLVGLFILLFIGTLFDYSISKTLVNRASLFGFLGANYGQIVAYIALSSGGLLLINEASWSKRLFGFLAISGSVVMIVNDGLKYGNQSYLIVLAGLVINFIAVYLLTNTLKRSGLNTNKWAYFLIGCVLAQVIVISIGKEIMVRPRMIAILDHQMSFQPWYQCNLEDKKIWLTMVGNADYLKSFPSGHSGAASMSFAIALALSNVKHRNTKRYMLLASGYTLTVMLSRIIMGAHFLSDTCMGALIGITCVMGMYYLLFKRSN